MTKELQEDICKETVYAKVYEKYAQELTNFLHYRYGENLNPQDKAQEALIKLWENCKKVPFSKVRSYLYTIANNLMLNEVKHQKVVLKYKKLPQKKYSGEDPEFILLQQEYFDQYQRALSKMSDEQRTAFLMNKVEGKKHQEIAEMLGVSRKVVEYRIYSAFDLLRKELQNFKI